jgi:radical SAM/Cys-rich protein
MQRVLPTLQKRHAPLAGPAAQRRLLDSLPLKRFEQSLADSGVGALRATGIDILQINLGKRCNQTCRHCHVDAGPDRTEVMPRAVIEAIFTFIASANVKTLDITGGAPELHPHFREIVERASNAGLHVMHRCNLTAVLLPNYADIPAILAKHNVEIVASLPYFQSRETDIQRGDGVFDESIRTLRILNELGYGRDNRHILNLVMNPVGTFLPGNQQQLESLWKSEMKRRYDVDFNHLYTITNMPISRFLEFLEEKGRTLDYMMRLVNAFNPAAAKGVMCRNTLSVGWDGTLYDCDFNQMLGMSVTGAHTTIFDAVRDVLEGRDIVVGPHCYGCTAGAGSSCGGSIA